MDRCAVLVDAGYLLGGAYTLLTGLRSDRSRLRPDYAALIEAIRVRAEGETGLPVLRIYWYDAAFQRQPTTEHRVLRALRDVKVRLGNLVLRGEGPPQQKGVDAELHADLVTLARNRAVADVVLVTGDEDLCVPVEKAQEHGVRVHLWAVPTSSSSTSQSPELVATADRRTVLETAWIDDHFTVGREPYAAVSVLPRTTGTVNPVRETPADADDTGPVDADTAPGDDTAPDDHADRPA
ncbi:NYN domain-containing protein, partial [Saccharomonospora iraqiensis]|uniref:NYN domain-containing protein n=1 Tax=Saccharomonospora iraqiensis TaxID=52698 RepID=UPI0012FC50EA